MTPPKRSLPRPFTYHWGSGQITEEASYSGQHHEAAIQLLIGNAEAVEVREIGPASQARLPPPLLGYNKDGEHAGEWSVRFCYYSPSGRFQRSPLTVGKDEIAGLRAALKRAPKLRKLLQKLVA